jgi:hypothetical protein
MATQTPQLNPELVDPLKSLRLGRIARSLPERLVLADKQQMSFDDLLLMILTDEIARRDNTAADNRATEARLETSTRLELWDKTAKVSFDKRILSELVSLRFLEAHRHAVVLAPSAWERLSSHKPLVTSPADTATMCALLVPTRCLARSSKVDFDNSRDVQMVSPISSIFSSSTTSLSSR